MDSPEELPKSRRSAGQYALGAAGLVILATVVIAASNISRTTLTEVDREDGTDALVNAVLIARADKLSTQEASDALGIDPKLPFLGTSAYAGKRHQDFAARHPSLKQQTTKLWMPNQYSMLKTYRESPALFQSLGDSPALFQSLEIDPSTQFCADKDDCLRNDDYFKQVIFGGLN